MRRNVHPECELSIITINYNGLNDTCALIDTIPFNHFSLEMIVVDNASTQDEASVIEQHYPQVKVIRSKENLGFAGGNNLGIQAAKGRYLFFVNNDTFFNDFNVDALIHRLESSPKIGMVCPKIRFAWDNQPIQFAGYTPLSHITMRNHSIGCGEKDKGQYETSHQTPYAHGAAMLVKRSALEQVGLMPECFFLYYEELDWSMMFNRAGFEIWYEPACTIFHKESRTVGIYSPLKIFYITRNRLLFVKRNFQGTNKILSYLYLITIVAPKDILKFTLKGRIDLIKATIRGVYNFIKS